MASSRRAKRLEGLFDNMDKEYLSSRDRTSKRDGLQHRTCRSDGKNSQAILNLLRSDAEAGFCDVILDVEGRKFPAHRCVLASNSRFFYSMFTSSMKEASDKSLKLHSLSPETMGLIVEYFYTSKIDINEINVLDILSASDYLLLASLRKECLSFVHGILGIHNCFCLRRLADKYCDQKLANQVDKFIELNFTAVIMESEDFNNLTLEELSALLERDDIQVEKEEDVYRGLMRWIKYDAENRHEALPNLLRSLRLGSLPADFLEDQLRREELMQNNPECKDFVKEVGIKKSKCNKAGANSTSDAIKERPSAKVHDVVFGMGSGTLRSPKMFCYVSDTKEVMSIANLYSGKTETNVAVLDDTLYAVGGSRHKSGASHYPMRYAHKCSLNPNKSGCVHFMPAGKSWKRISDLGNPRYNHAVTALRGCVYAIGGTGNQNVCLGSVECYNPEENSWGCVSQLNSPRSELSAVATTGHIYAIGGKSPEVLNSVERYDPETNSWDFIASLSMKRAAPNTIFLSGKIYVVGGKGQMSEDLTSCEVYSVSTDEWHSIAPLPCVVPHSQCILNFQGQVVVVMSSVRDDFDAVRYNEQEETWQKEEHFGPCKKMGHFNLISVRIPAAFLHGLITVSNYFFEEPVKYHWGGWDSDSSYGY